MQELVMRALLDGKMLVIKMNSNDEAIDNKGNAVADNKNKILVTSDNIITSPATIETRQSYQRNNTYTDKLPKPKNVKNTNKINEKP